MPRSGFVLDDAAKSLAEHDLFAVVRRDARGRRFVVPLDLPESRVRELVVRVTRDLASHGEDEDSLTMSQSKTLRVLADLLALTYRTAYLAVADPHKLILLHESGLVEPAAAG